MTRSILQILGLLAAFCGTPLRQAEAAGDFARGVAEIMLGQVIEPVDGGVGDDSGVTVAKLGAEPRPNAPAASSRLRPPSIDRAKAPSLARGPVVGSAPLPPWPPPAPTLRRLACHQHFRF